MTFDYFHEKYPLWLAPMEDVTDKAFRIVNRRRGADLVFTEFASAEALIRESRKTLEKIRLDPEERPAAIQIFGGCPESIRKAVQIAEREKPDLIDVNCGCWVRKVA
jgi:tRNA-dihydrouridine synthase